MIVGAENDARRIHRDLQCQPCFLWLPAASSITRFAMASSGVTKTAHRPDHLASWLQPGRKRKWPLERVKQFGVCSTVFVPVAFRVDPCAGVGKPTAQ